MSEFFSASRNHGDMVIVSPQFMGPFSRNGWTMVASCKDCGMIPQSFMGIASGLSLCKP